MATWSEFVGVLLLLFCSQLNSVSATNRTSLDNIITDPKDDAHQACVKIFVKSKIDVNHTRYENRRCLVHCYIGGHPWSEFINQNRSCPDDSTGFCDFGVCRHNFTNVLGSLNVTILNGDFEKPAESLVEVCVHNSSTRIPFYIEEPQNCTQCSSELPTNLTRTPVWNITCDDIASAYWNLNSRLLFRFYNFTDNGTTYANQTIGTSKLSITQMLSDFKNGIEQYLPISNSRTIGHFFVKVLWSPLTNFFHNPLFQDEEEEYEYEEY